MSRSSQRGRKDYECSVSFARENDLCRAGSGKSLEHVGPALVAPDLTFTEEDYFDRVSWAGVDYEEESARQESSILGSFGVHEKKSKNSISEEESYEERV